MNDLSKQTESNLQPCLTGEQIVLLPVINAYVIELRQLISAPNDIYQELYLPTLHRFMAFCQAMPLSMENPVAYSLLTQRLELAIAVLKLRRGHMLPQHSHSETVAEQEPLWTYALFITSLLIQIHLIQSDRTVELYQDKNKKLGDWHPVVGSLCEIKTYYRIIPKENPINIRGEILQSILLGKIVPQIGMRWLAGCGDVFLPLLDAVTEKDATGNVLVQRAQQAAQKIGFPLIEREMPSFTTKTDFVSNIYL